MKTYDHFRPYTFFGICFAFVFFCSFFLVPVMAASEDVEAVLAQLSTLQNNDIDAEWPPDIEANEALVEELLLSYQDLTDEQRAELSAVQTRELNAYFVTLYEVQGKDVDDLEDLMAQAPLATNSTASSASSAASSSANSTPASSAALPSTSTAPDSTSVPSSAPESLPAAVAEDNHSNTALPSLASFSFLQASSSEGPFAFFASVTLGQTIFFCSLVLVALLFLKFLWTLVSLGPPPGSFRKKHRERKKQKKAEKEFQDVLFEPDSPLDEGDDAFSEENMIDVKGAFNTEDLQAIDALITEKKTIQPPLDPVLSGNTQLPATLSEELISPVHLPGSTLADLPSAVDKNSTTLPKLGDARTGRPARMPFSQGDAYDLDAIDD